MERTLSTTPFGRRSLSLAMVASQVAAKACPPDAVAHKWQVFRCITEAKEAIGASDRALSVLNALLSFHPETALTADGDLIVFPSNNQLALRAHGMAPATLRRHLAALVECGLVIRRDSPNGKRYARKGQGGAIETAFGFDLKPIVARVAEFEALAEAARAERRAYLLLRERITLYRRDIAKMIATGLEEGIPADWRGYHSAYLDLSSRIPRTATTAELGALADELAALVADIRKVLEDYIQSENMSDNESHSDRHIQNSKPDPLESEPAPQRSRGELPSRSETPRSPQRSFPLGMVLDACPDITDYARQGINSWRDFIATARLVRSALGISPSAWEDACSVMGEDDASVTVAAILQRSEAINSPGGYLRNLTEKARGGQFSLGPVLMALLRGKLRDRRSA